MRQESARVLIVEDEAIVAMDLRQRIERMGYQVVGAVASGKLAIQRATEFRPDLILMDVHLQGEMDGVTAADRIRQICDAPVIFLTAFSDAITVQRATGTEPFGYIVKPVDERELEIAIVVALYRRRAEAARQLLTSRLSLATAVARVGIWEWDLPTNELTWDATMFDIYGFLPAVALPYAQWAAAVHPDDLATVEGARQRAIDEKGQASTEFRIVVAGGVKNISAVERVVLDEGANVTRVIGVNMDITEGKIAAELLRNSEARHAHSAQHDFLTGLPNRMLLHDRVRQAIALATRHTKKFAVLFLDLDGFKHVNDSLGHLIGDRLLISIATRLVACSRGSDTVSRLGGDEFVVLIPEVDKAEDAALAARRILQAVADAHAIDEHVLHITTSIGLSVYPDDGLEAETLIKNADTAMYHAKRNGCQRYQFFKPDMNDRAVERQSIEESLRRALERQEFVLHYQPKVNLKTGQISGAEALIRWTHPILGAVPPAQFIPAAEACGLIVPIGSWVLREACRQAMAWADAGLRPTPMAVNVASLEFRGGSYVEGVLTILQETGMDPGLLELELSETVVMQHAESAQSILKALKANGVRLTVDDFGTGYSSLSHLAKFPLDTLKIDQSFIQQLMTTAADGSGVVMAILSMGRSLNLRVVAEGVETQDALTFLKANHCDEAQGYYFSRPVLPGPFGRLLETGFAGKAPVAT